MGTRRERERQELTARAERVGSRISAKVLDPLLRDIAGLQAALSAIAVERDSPERRGAPPPDRDATERGTVGNARSAPVVFLHIPKTAGTTATLWLRLLHGGGCVKAPSYTGSPEKLQRLSVALRERPYEIQSVAGHVPLSVRAHFPPASAFFTLLRAPVARALSHFSYFHARKAGPGSRTGNSISDQAAALTRALDTWDAASPDSQAVLPDNLQTRMLSGFAMDAPASRDMLDAAKRNLSALDAVGLTERFDESMVLLHHVYGWKLLALQSRRVRGPQRLSAEVLDTSTVERVRCLNALDEELYEAAVRRFDALLSTARGDAAREVAALRRAREIEYPDTYGTQAPPDPGTLDPLVAGILADTAAALDRNGSVRAERLLETLAAQARQARLAMADHTQQMMSLTRQFTDLINRRD